VTGDIILRDMREEDFSFLFEYQLEPAARHMAAFTSKDSLDREAYIERWGRLQSDHTVMSKTLVLDGSVIGMIASFERLGQREVTYWLGQEYWGRGLATSALSQFTRLLQPRPLYARAAKDNIASIRVLEKCGFTLAGEDKMFSNARGEDVEEVIFELS
jgi:RimJ/RimL family protein N-acetyltransferase